MADLFDFLPPPATTPASPAAYRALLVEQIARDKQALADPLYSESDHAFFRERIQMYIETVRQHGQ